MYAFFFLITKIHNQNKIYYFLIYEINQTMIKLVSSDGDLSYISII